MGRDGNNFVFGDTEGETVFIYVYIRIRSINVCVISVYFREEFITACALFGIYGKNMAEKRKIH